MGGALLQRVLRTHFRRRSRSQARWAEPTFDPAPAAYAVGARRYVARCRTVVRSAAGRCSRRPETSTNELLNATELVGARFTNDATYFLDAQLRVIEQAILDLHTYLAKKTAELHRTTLLLKSTDCLNHRQIALIGHALRHPGAECTIQSHRSSHKVTYETARADLLGLAERALLDQRKVGRAFHFTAAINLESNLSDLG